MGQTMDAIALKFFGDKEPEKGLKLMERCCEYENEYLSIHGGILYDRLEETLKRLSANHRLFIVSNCQSGYIEAFLKFYGFEKYITDHLCWGDNKLPKSENIRLIMEKNHVADGHIWATLSLTATAHMRQAQGSFTPPTALARRTGMT